MSLFIEKGFHNVSIHDIQKPADVSIGLIYKYFEGKTGIATALNKHLLNEFDELVRDVIQDETSPLKQCKEIISAEKGSVPFKWIPSSKYLFIIKK